MPWTPSSGLIKKEESTSSNWKPSSGLVAKGPVREIKKLPLVKKDPYVIDDNPDPGLMRRMQISRMPMQKSVMNTGFQNSLAEGSMLESAAHPKTAEDMLGLVIPSELPNLRRAFGGSSRVLDEVAPNVPSVTKEPWRATPDEILQDSRINSLPPEVAKPIEPHPSLMNTQGTPLMQNRTLEAPVATPKNSIGSNVNVMSDSPRIKSPVNTPSGDFNPDALFPKNKPNPFEAVSELRQKELLNKFGGRNAIPELETKPMGSTRLEAESPNSIAPIEPKGSGASKIEPIGDIPELERGDILDSQFRAAMNKKEVEGLRPKVSKMNSPTIGRSGAFDSSHGPTNEYFNGKKYDMSFASDAQDAASKSKSRAFRDWAEKKKSETGAINIDVDLPNTKFGKAVKQSIEEHGITSTIGNTMKSALSTGDLSAPLRQGAALIHRKEFRNALKPMIEMFNDEKVFTAGMNDIKESSGFNFADKMDLELTGLNAGREERFLNPAIMESIPGYGRAVRASDRAYTGFLNKLRFDTFNSLIQDAEAAGHLKINKDLYGTITGTTNDNLAKEIATFVNEATGRGGLGVKGEKAADLLNATIFSPRFVSSRIKLIGRVIDPGIFIKQSSFVRKQALKSAIALASTNITINGLAAAAGAKITYDITNSDFMKNKFGNTRSDFGAGVLQPLVFAGRMLTGKFTSSTTGKTHSLKTPKFGESTYKDVATNAVLSKESPLAGLAYEVWTGQDLVGNKVSIPEAVMNRFVPMIVQDMYDIMKDDPRHAGLIIPGIFGASTQTYKKLESKPRLPSMSISMPR